MACNDFAASRGGGRSRRGRRWNSVGRCRRQRPVTPAIRLGFQGDVTETSRSVQNRQRSRQRFFDYSTKTSRSRIDTQNRLGTGSRPATPSLSTEYNDINQVYWRILNLQGGTPASLSPRIDSVRAPWSLRKETLTSLAWEDSHRPVARVSLSHTES